MNHLCENAATGSEERPLNFLEEIIEESIARGDKRVISKPVSRPNRTVICISATPKVSA